MGLDQDRIYSFPAIFEELICVICQSILEDPLETPCCKCTFCSICVCKWLEVKEECPVCWNVLTKHMLKPPCNIVKNILCNIELTCVNKKLGCDAIMKVEQESDHISTCPFKPKSIILKPKLFSSCAIC